MRQQIHSSIRLVLVCVMMITMTTSVFVSNLVWVLLLANWVAEWDWRQKFAHFSHQYLLQAFLVLLGVHLLWLLGTHNIAYALFDIQKKLPLFLIPLVLLTSPPPTQHQQRFIAFFYITTVLVVSFIGFARYLLIPDLPYRELVPYISHIRFGLNVSMAVCILCYCAIKYRAPWLYGLNTLLVLWFLFFLALLHAYTAFAILIVTSLVLSLAYGKRLQPVVRRATTCAVVVLVVGAAGLSGYYCYDYYHLKPLSTAPLKPLTPNGNPYLHRQDGLIENGNYVHHYVSEHEMRVAWAKLSQYPFDSITPVGYTVYPALLRYLNGMGLTKDSLGMTHLTPSDVAAIEKGIANPVYLQRSPRKLIYVMCYEYENYRCYRSVKNFTMLQRLELWRNGAKVLLQHPILGVGTGDVVDACQQQMLQSQSPLADSGLHTHNQYLNFALAFGLLGLLVIVFFFVRAIRLTHSFRSVLFAAFLCILLISFLTEDTLETLAGILFASLGWCLTCHNPQQS